MFDTRSVSSDDSSHSGLTPSFTLDIVGTNSAYTGSAAPTLTVEGVKSSDADLRSLFTLPGDLEFDADTTEYMVNVLQSVTSVTVYVFPRDYRATVKLDGVLLGSDELWVQISLVEGENKAIPVVVTAEDGVTTRAYKVTVVQVPVTVEEEQEPSEDGSDNQGSGEV